MKDALAQKFAGIYIHGDPSFFERHFSEGGPKSPRGEIEGIESAFQKGSCKDGIFPSLRIPTTINPKDVT